MVTHLLFRNLHLVYRRARAHRLVGKTCGQIIQTLRRCRSREVDPIDRSGMHFFPDTGVFVVKNVAYPLQVVADRCTYRNRRCLDMPQYVSLYEEDISW